MISLNDIETKIKSKIAVGIRTNIKNKFYIPVN